jgi:hypothetical protein
LREERVLPPGDKPITVNKYIILYRLRVSENRVLRRIFGPTRDEVIGEWRKLHEELNDLYPHPQFFG